MPSDEPAEKIAVAAIDEQAIHALASVLMYQGMGLMTGSNDSNGVRPEAVAAALLCFDRALELRRRLPLEPNPAYRYDLAACWLNRAEALMLVPGQASSALAAFDEAIVLLQGLPLQQEGRFLRRLAIAHQNRGLALQSLDPPQLAPAAQAFADALALLDLDPADAPIADRHHLQAVVAMNLAMVLAAEGGALSLPQACAAARRAIALVASSETTAPEMAEIGLKARHALCRALAPRLSATAPTGAAIPDDVHEATDAADDGLVLIRHWERAGVTRFRGIACDLFRFGAFAYARYQPQFLQAFILDNMDPETSSAAYVEDPAIRAVLQEAIGLTLHG